MCELSEYEKKRIQRIRENESFLKTLGLDLKSRRGELSEAGSSSKRRRRRRAGSEDDDDDWVPGVEEAPRRSRRARKTVSYKPNVLFKLPQEEKLSLKEVTRKVTRQVEEVFKQGLSTSKCGVGRAGGRRGDTPTEVPDVELPDFFDDSNDPEVFYGFSEDECHPELAGDSSVDRVCVWVLPSEVEDLFNSDSDDTDFEGFDEDESFFALFEEAKEICCVTRQSARKVGQEKTYTEDELSDEDEYLYCEECGQINRGDCPIHGPLTPLDESLGVDEASKQFTSVPVPKQLTVKGSTIPDAGMGVYSKEYIPKGTRCGPYRGTIVDKMDIGADVDTAYMWEIKKSGCSAYYLDGSDEATSNWMRFVNCARSETEQNMVAFQFCGEMYYRTYRDIYPGTELLVWYGEEYAKDLGIEVTSAHLDYCSDSDDSSDNEDKPKFRTSFVCRGCGASFVEHSSFKIHLKYNRECLEANPQIFSCRLCGEKYGRLFELQDHIRKHEQLKDISTVSTKEADTALNYVAGVTRWGGAGKKTFTCTYCDKAFTSDGYLKTHIRIHTGDRPYQCTYCGKTFTTDGSLKTHIRIHTGDRPYQCTYCGKAFTTDGNLKTHIRIHTGDRPYQCTYCGKAFTTDGSLKTHIRIHTGNRPYQCTYCGKTFTTDGNLKTHIRIHTGDRPYQCTYCGKAFTTDSDLKRHIRIHTGDRPYQCTYCGKAFTTDGDLKRHIRIHTGDKPYQCTYCDKAFITSRDMKKHINTFHGI